MYCQYCGKEAREGELFCKYCGKSLTEPWKPSPFPQPQRKPSLIYRTVPWDTALGGLWAFLGFFILSEYNLTYYWRSYYHVDIALAGFVIVVGILAGVYISKQWANKTLRTIEEKGVFELTLRYLLYVIGAVVVAIALIVWSFGNVPQSTLIYVLDFIYPLPAVGFFTRATAFRRWQKRNKTVIYAQSGVFLGKIYPYPPLSQVGSNKPAVN